MANESVVARLRDSLLSGVEVTGVVANFVLAYVAPDFAFLASVVGFLFGGAPSDESL